MNCNCNSCMFGTLVELLNTFNRSLSVICSKANKMSLAVQCNMCWPETQACKLDGFRSCSGLLI